MKWLGWTFIRLTRSFVRRVAEAYDIRLNRPWEAQGPHPVIFDDPPSRRRHLIPKSVYFNTGSGAIRVGAGTMFGEDVQLLTGKYLSIEDARRSGAFQSVPAGGRDIVIGRNGFLGGVAILIGPVTIGDYAVIMAGAVVTRDVAPGAVVAGVPARVVRVMAVNAIAAGGEAAPRGPS